MLLKSHQETTYVDDPNFINALRGLQEERRQPKRRPLKVIEDCKINKLPKLMGGTDAEYYLEWERKIDQVFECKDFDNEKCCKYTILKLSGGASLWYEALKAKRVRERKEKVASSVSLKKKLRKRCVPTHHRTTTYNKMAILVQGKMSVGEYINEFEKLTLLVDVEDVEE